jgi:hypothetical protein
MVYGNDAMARDQGLDAEARLRFHQQYSGPLMDQLHSLTVPSRAGCWASESAPRL